MNKITSIIIITFALSISSAHALKLAENKSLHGFVSQGYVYSPDNAFAERDTKNGSFNFRELGLNGSWNINNEFRVTGQLLSRTLGDVDDGDLRVDFLLADYLAYSDENTNMGIRLGRVKTPLGLYNGIRDIPSARPGINVPFSIYFDAFRDSVISVDGLNLYGNAFSEEGSLNWQVYAGTTEIDSAVFEKFIFAQEIQGKFDDVDLFGVKLDFSPTILPGFNFGISLMKFDTNLLGAQTTGQASAALMTADSVTAAATFAATPVSFGGLGYVPSTDGQFEQFVGSAAQQEAADNSEQYITSLDLSATFAILSMQYAYEDWLLSAEYLKIDSNAQFGVLGMVTPVKGETVGYYLQAEWFFQDNLTALLRYEELYLDPDDRDGSESARDNNLYYGYGKSLTLGIGWDITNDWNLTGQASANEGSFWLPSYDDIENDEIKKYWKTYMLQLAYQF